MNLSWRGLILGGTAMLGGCASATIGPAPTVPSASAALTMQVELLPLAAPLGSPGPLDPSGVVRKELMQRAMAVLDTYPRRIALRDRIYLVDFRKHSGEPRLHEVNLLRGEITTFRTTHGRGSDPVNSGFAHDFSNTPDSFKSSLGAYATAGAGWGRQ